MELEVHGDELVGIEIVNDCVAYIILGDDSSMRNRLI